MSLLEVTDTAGPAPFGHMKSLARPDGNTTSVSVLAVDLDGKRQDILIEAVPGFAGWLRLPMSITTPYPLAASADCELGLQFLNFRVVQRLYRRSSLGSIGLLPDLGLFCWARPNGQRLACLLAVVDTYGKAIGTGLL